MSKAILFSLIVLFSLSCSIGGSPSKSVLHQMTTTDRSATLSFENLNNWIIIPIYVDGESEPLKFLFDTGSSSVLTEKTANKLNIVPHRQQAVMGANGVTAQVPVALIKKFDVGNLSFKNVEIAILKDAELQAFKCHREEIDGILGGELISNSNWEIDFVSSTMHTGDRTKRYEAAVPFYIENRGIPFIELEIEKQKIPLIFDTGNNGSIILSNQQNEQLLSGIDARQNIFGVNTKTATGSIEQNGILLEGVAFSHDSKLIGIHASVLMPISRNYFGLSALRASKFVYLDYTKKLLHIGNLVKQPLPYNSFGFQVTELNGTQVLTRVLQKIKEEEDLVAGLPIEAVVDSRTGEPIGHDPCSINAMLAQKDSIDIIMSLEAGLTKRIYKQSIFR